MKNLELKRRPLEDPYEIWVGSIQIDYEPLNMEWRVLKKYHADDNQENARWLVAVKSEATHGSYEYGDIYAKNIKQFAKRIK